MKHKVMMNSLDGTYKIVSIVTIPDQDKENYPVVVMCHGTGSTKDEAGNLYVELSEKLLQAGIASIRFDFIGNGDSTEDYIGYTLTSAVNDVKSIVNYIKSNTALDEDRMGIVGFSQGGSIAVLSLEAVEEFKCMVGWSAALTLDTLMNEEMRNTAEKQGWAWLNFDFRDPVRLSKQWMDEASQMDLLAILKERHLPMLFIAGTLDTLVPCECSKKMIQATNHSESELVLVEADHIFNVFDHNRVWPTVIEKTVLWLSEKL